jgi:hypothetical protein
VTCPLAGEADDAELAEAEPNGNTVAATATPREAESGSSTYATGGGGVSLAHRIAGVYLACILTGARRTEASELPVRRVSFQTGPAHPIDDLLVECSDGTTEVTIAVACRATPNFVQSDQPSVKLVSSLLDEAARYDSDSHHVAVAVAGWRNQWQHLATVCEIARSNANAAAFKASLDVDRRWPREVRDRLEQFLGMVRLATEGTKTEAEVLQLAFALLSRLHVIGFAVQSPDERDRTASATSLDLVAADGVDGIAIRDRLEVEATRYDATGAVVDINVLRRDIHGLLKTATTRNTHAWEVLAEHRRVAAASVRGSIGADFAGANHFEIAFADRRTDLRAAILTAGTGPSALVVSGESGTGKSALTLSTVAQLEADDPNGFEALVVNFRALPRTSMDLHAALGAPAADVLAELSAPTRVLVIDAADAALEHSAGLLSDLVAAAKSAGVGVVAVTADTALEFVIEQMTLIFGEAVASFTMSTLGDTDIDAVAQHFPLLRAVLRDLPAASLLRRLVILDLLARTGIELAGAMSEWDCLQLIWRRVIRGEGDPAAGSAEAREQVVLSIAAATLNLPANQQQAATFDSTAVDALRRDHLLTPASPYLSRPEFAHDEVRRYATAILLVRARSITQVLETAGGPRWALSAATVACKGQLLAPGTSAAQTFSRLVREFSVFAGRFGPRWSDVPVEAVLDNPTAYECLATELRDGSSPIRLDEVVRVVEQRHRVNGLPDPLVAAPVIRILLDSDEPWRVSKPSFQLLASWLQSLVMLNVAAGDLLRIALRDRLLAYWTSFPLPGAPEDDSEDDKDEGLVETGFGPTHHRARLPYQLIEERLVECLALLGPDIDEAVEKCLLAIADAAPARLAAAADSPLSARAIALHDPELLARLMEGYYIDAEETSWHLEEGVRDHQGRWKALPPPFSEYYYGGFWALFNLGSPKTSIRVLNRILNHGAVCRVRTLVDLSSHPFEVAIGREQSPEDRGNAGAQLNLDGTPRLYVGDTHVWSWYRGTSVGPYSAMSALLAIERVVEGWLDAGVSPEQIVRVLLDGCENLAVPGMLFGVLVRHIEAVKKELDPFLAEPIVWQLEFARTTGEYSGLRAHTEDLKHQDRRNWTPREVCVALMAQGDSQRAQELKAVGDLLIANGDRLGVSRELTRNWAASLDADRYEVVQEDSQLYLQVNPPDDLKAAQAEYALRQEHVSTILRLQSRYWGSARYDADYVPPTSAEVAEDLASGRKLLELDNEVMATEPLNAVAHVVRVAIQRAGIGEIEALGNEGKFAAQLVLKIALSFKDSADQREEGQYFDLSADRAVADALPALLLPALADLLPPIGASTADVGKAGLAVAGKAPLETRLYLARGCDILWVTPCHGSPCIHETAIDWLLETARVAEIGAWDATAQHRAHVEIAGDIAARLQQLDGASIDLNMLDAVIRGLGAAAASSHCCTPLAERLLAQILDVQRRTMVSHKAAGWSVDYRGDQSLVAARALLDTFATNHDAEPVLGHLDVLSTDASLLSGFLHGLAAAGAENDRLAKAACDLWPTLLGHALTYADQDPNPYRDDHWGDWAAAALLPEPLSWSQGVHNELSGPPVEWVKAEDLVDLIDHWIPLGHGEIMCVDALIRIVRKLPLAEQVTRGLSWITDLCTHDGEAVVNHTWLSNDWLKETRSTAEELNALGEWQWLVDAMVVAGNEGLAPYSR